MNRAILAVAGGRKTQLIVDECSSGSEEGYRLALTFTLTGQSELHRRLCNACKPGSVPEVLGWYAFLLRHLIRPYIQLLFPGQRVVGLHFDDTEPEKKRYATGAARYFDRDGRAYKMHLSKLAVEVLKASKGAAINRLERIYNDIYIDEIQDLTGNDLIILEELMDSKIRMVMVGDIRQAILSTNPSDMKYAKYRGLNRIDWFRQLHKNGVCSLEERSTTWRSNQTIASFADSVLPVSYAFSKTLSEQNAVTSHDGVFLVSFQDLAKYLETFSPSCFRYSKVSVIPGSHAAINFGQCKGLTCPRVLVYPTVPILEFLKSGKPLKGKSAAGLYVAVTRAVHSVAFVVQDPCKFLGRFPQWPSAD